MEQRLLPPPGFAELELCGMGATSHVYRAIDRRNGGQKVALKRLNRQLARNDEAVARLKRELDALVKLHHPSIVLVRDVIRWQGQPTIVMAFIEGIDLAQRRKEVGRLHVDEVERIARTLLDVLIATHAAGIVHRDVKPHNVRIGVDGRIFLLDFGSARLDAASELTATGTTVGTPEYMAPELFLGSVYDPRVDLYGLGTLLFECLTGSPPLPADSLAELAHRRTTTDAPPIRSLAECPEALALVIDRCLARAPEDRFPSAARALWALDHPKEERTFARRRSRRPPCLHCGAPTPPEAGLCAECKSDRPFRYDPGTASVMLTGVESVPELLAWVADRFPERADPVDLAPVAEACGILSNGPVRLAGGISAGDAALIQGELGSIGAHTKIERHPSNTKTVVRSLVLAGIMAVGMTLLLGGHLGDLSLLLFIAAPALTFAAFISRARARSLLGRSGGGLAIASKRIALMNVAVGSAVPVIAAILAANNAPRVSNELAPAVAVTLGATLLIALLAQSLRTAKSAVASAEPSIRDKIRAAIVAPNAAIAAPSVASRALAGVVFAIGVSAVIPLELYALQGIRELTAAPLIRRAAPGPAGRPAAPTIFGRAPGEPIIHPGPRTRWQPKGHLWLYAAPALALLILAFVVRRRRLIRMDAQRSLEAVDPGRLAIASRRAIPMRSRSAGVRQLPAEIASDGFITTALGITSELDAGLERADAARLWEAFDGLRKAAETEARRERSLEARCILETDRTQWLRFEFLKLAGEMEAKASETWAGSEES